MKTPNLDTTQDLELSFIPEYQASTFTVTGDYEAVMPIADEIKALADAPSKHAAQTAVQAPQPALPSKPVYEDFSTLAPRDVLRRKISAWVYDRRNGTTMLDLLNQRIEDDRNVAFARNLGLLGVTHCAKHEKAVAKLKHLV